MGTRADFYVGRDEGAEWVGSIAWDGYRNGIDDAVLAASTEEEFRSAVSDFFATRDDVTRPHQGWPWPWDNSRVTDCSYWFFDGKVWDDRGHTYQDCTIPEPETDDDYEKSVQGAARINYPDMSARKNVQLGGSRSGLIVVTG